jgi:putative glutamine amidotransferase
MKIAITKDTSNEEKFRKYESWLLRFNPSLEFHELTYENSRPDEIDACDGVLFSGGGDIHPKFYGGVDAFARTKNVNEHRDEFEFGVIDRALARKLPVLGVCRGLQSINVHFGGTLHCDLESDGFSQHTELDGKENRHQVAIERPSMLGSILGTESGEVNSLHHQGVDAIGKELVISARSKDGVVEALEWADRAGKPFLMLVQWHPERMKDTSNPLAERIGRIFLEETQKHQRHS